jgi:hypothetical protein
MVLRADLRFDRQRNLNALQKIEMFVLLLVKKRHRAGQERPPAQRHYAGGFMVYQMELGNIFHQLAR